MKLKVKSYAFPIHFMSGKEWLKDLAVTLLFIAILTVAVSLFRAGAGWAIAELLKLK